MKGGGGRGRTRATSAGGIVVREGADGPELLLGLRRRERDQLSWTLPKGTPIAGESVEQTALREVEEETGLQVRIVCPVGSIRYRFMQRGSLIDKTVHFYLMEAVGGDLDRHDQEFEDVRWVPVPEAERIMTHETERSIAAQGLEARRRLGLPLPEGPRDAGPEDAREPTPAAAAAGDADRGAGA